MWHFQQTVWLNHRSVDFILFYFIFYRAAWFWFTDHIRSRPCIPGRVSSSKSARARAPPGTCGGLGFIPGWHLSDETLLWLECREQTAENTKSLRLPPPWSTDQRQHLFKFIERKSYFTEIIHIMKHSAEDICCFCFFLHELHNAALWLSRSVIQDTVCCLTPSATLFIYNLPEVPLSLGFAEKLLISEMLFVSLFIFSHRGLDFIFYLCLVVMVASMMSLA